jgi:hypothetical protein
MAVKPMAAPSRLLFVPGYGDVDPSDGAALVHAIMQGQAAAAAAERARLAVGMGMDDLAYATGVEDERARIRKAVEGLQAVDRDAILAVIDGTKGEE